MSIEAGHQLAHYEILELIGKGGMGEVYRARDGRLGRDVAIKVLPDEFAQDAERLRRFQREAKVLASLNHPNIAAIYGLEQSEGTHYLVLELVPGETLAQRIARGPIPVEEALQIGAKITEALEAAHEQIIVHRDLKPANVKLTAEDNIKVLDFGIAKAFAQETPDSDSSMSPTLTRDATRAGVIMGTAAYMSPEQAKGKKVDARTDIFAFGAVLYEMLTGRKAFPGEDVSEMLAAVIKSEPDWNALPSQLDARILNLLRRCLRKDRKNRRQSIGDVRVEIQEILDEPDSTSVGQPVAVSPASRAREGLAWGLLVVALVTGIALWPTRPGPAPPRVTRFALALQEDHQLGGRRALRISPDGRHIAYASRPSSGGTSQVYVRPIDQLVATALAGTDGAQFPFFSPDGQWVGFFAQGELKKVPLNGGTPLTLCKADSLTSAHWDMSSIVFSSGNRLLRVSSDGGAPEAIASYENATLLSSPEILPGGNAVLYNTWPALNIVVESLDTGEQQILTAGNAPHYLPTGYLVFARGSSLLTARFDLDRLELVSSPVPVLEGVRSAGGRTQFQISSEGTLLYVQGRESTPDAGKVVLVNREGAEQTITGALRDYRSPRVSPDGERFAVDIAGVPSNLWIIERVRGTLTRLTFGDLDVRPLWSPDGNQVVFASGRAGAIQIFSKPADGSGTTTQLTTGTHRVPTSLSSDGKTLVFRQNSEETGLDIGTVRLGVDQNAEPEMLLETPFHEHTGMLSPDDRWLAYVSDDSGREEVYVTPFPGPGGRQPISTEGGAEPAWSRDGRELYYRNGEALMAVTITTEPVLAPGKPTLLFTGPYRSGVDRIGNPGSNYDVTPDGRFVMIREEESSKATQIQIVLNWFEELDRLVPTEE